MEETLCQEAIEVADETDDEEEVIGNKKSAGKRKMVIDDDDEEDNVDGDDQMSISEANQSDEETPTVPGKESEKSSDKRPSDGEERDDHDDADGPLQLNLSSDEEGSDVDSHRVKLNKDIFDAESSDDEVDKTKPSSSQGAEGANFEDKVEEEEENADNSEDQRSDDEGFDEEGLDPELLAKLKKLKGASKTTKERAKYERKSKPTTDQMLELHSESQRLTRDSRVNLPYYEPEEKSLDDFLARASKKKQEYAALRRATDFQKAQIIQDKLSVTPPKLTPTRKSSRKSAVESSQASSQPSPAVVSADDQLQDSGLVSQDVTNSQLQVASQSSTVQLGGSQENNRLVESVALDDMGDDELPDLHIENVPKQVPAVTVSSESPTVNVSSLDISFKDKTGSAVSSTNNNQELVSMLTGTTNQSLVNQVALEVVPQLQKDPSRDLFSSQGAIGQESLPQHTVPESEPSSLVSVINETPLSSDLTQESASSVVSNSLADSTLTSQSKQTPSVPEPSLFLQTPDVTVEPSQTVLDTDDSKTVLSADSEQTLTLQQSNANLEEGVSPSAPDKSTPKDKRKSLLDKLQSQGLAIPLAPKLCGTPSDVICLDEPESKPTPKNPGLINLMDRLAKHSQKRAPRAAKDVDISIIEKEGTEGDQRLKLKSVTYHIQPEEDVSTTGSPGSKLSKLKQQLSIGMRKKREEARQRRIQLFNMDNEEGFERGEGEEEEEEEAEMTDDGDVSSDEDEDMEERRLGQLDEEDDGEDYNPLLDTEAQDDDDEEEEKEDAVSDFNEDSNDFHLNFEVSDEEEGEKEKEEDDEVDKDDFGLTSVKKKKAIVVSDDEEEENGEDVFDENKDDKKDIDEGSESLWSNDGPMTPLSRHLADTQPQGQTKFRRQSSCSPDLYASASAIEEDGSSQYPASHNNDSLSQGYAQSQMLDADGYLKVTQTQKAPKSRIAMLAQSPPDESEVFASSMSIGHIFAGATSQVAPSRRPSDNDNMKELMGLCSGKFKPESDEEDSLPSSQTRLKSTQSFDTAQLFEENNGDVYDPFKILSQDENAQDFVSLKKKKSVLESDDEEDKENQDQDTDDVDDDDDQREEDEEGPTFKGFKDKKRRIRREFFEDEAELSGSEFDSDENEELAEEDDILEEEEGDRDMAGVSESKLRNQVGRLHMKQLQDDDDREIMRYKEMYLQDGDLYTDGKGRRRNFRWKDIDNSSQQDMFTNDSEEEAEAEEDPADSEWRKDRYERDKFLEEEEAKDASDNSQLIKLGQGFLHKKDSFSMASQDVVAAPKEKKAVNQKKFKLPNKGSFLSRSKDALVKIAKMAKSAWGGNVKNSRGFVFQTVEEKESQDESLPTATPMQQAKRKAHTPSQPEQAAKKPKLSEASVQKPTVKRIGSILNHLQ